MQLADLEKLNEARRARRAAMLITDLGTGESLVEVEGEDVEPIILKYINRLSDYLFVLARYTGHQMHIEDIPWKPRV